MEPMSRNRQIITTIVVLVIIIGGLLLAVIQMGILKDCLALLNCG